jgi:hypothetical protein
LSDERAWWQRGYPGAPMVKVAGFPRPLYPPDASQYGKRASQDGPDVTAYKRTVSRAGRWPWQQFDDSFTNGFAHGKAGGNVGDSGIAGVQRQQHIDDTGWLGKTTFNVLRSIVVPGGLPHAGEMAMDETSVVLINEAWALFGGHEPNPPDKGTVRGAALVRMTHEIGVAESPSGSNRCKYTDWYGMIGPWCAMFCAWGYELGAGDVDKDSPSFVRGERYAYVPYIVGDARAGRYGLQTTDDPQPGDLVCFDWGWDGEFDHVGVFEEWLGAGWFATIEGNTSNADNSNGGQVMRRERSTSGQATVFVRVSEP